MIIQESTYTTAFEKYRYSTQEVEHEKSVSFAVTKRQGWGYRHFLLLVSLDYFFRDARVPSVRVRTRRRTHASPACTHISHLVRTLCAFRRNLKNFREPGPSSLALCMLLVRRSTSPRKQVSSGQKTHMCVRLARLELIMSRKNSCFATRKVISLPRTRRVLASWKHTVRNTYVFPICTASGYIECKGYIVVSHKFYIIIERITTWHLTKIGNHFILANWRITRGNEYIANKAIRWRYSIKRWKIRKKIIITDFRTFSPLSLLLTWLARQLAPQCIYTYTCAYIHRNYTPPWQIDYRLCSGRAWLTSTRVHIYMHIHSLHTYTLGAPK